MRTSVRRVALIPADAAHASPMAFASDNMSIMWLICILQCLQAVPQVRESIKSLKWRRELSLDDTNDS